MIGVVVLNSLIIFFLRCFLKRIVMVELGMFIFYCFSFIHADKFLKNKNADYGICELYYQSEFIFQCSMKSQSFNIFE